MKKLFLAITAVTVTALLVSGCSSEEPPSELDIIINNLQTSNLPPETEPEDVTTPEDTEDESEITVSGNGADVVYNSITGIVLSADEERLSIESGGVRYDILISEDTEIFGGTVSEEKTVTVTYISVDGDTGENITAAAITILQEESSESE